MSDINTLLQQIQSAIDLSNQLSKDPVDNFANCSSALETARATLVADTDRSAECKCMCHTLGNDWHALPCGCYTGDPVLE